MAWAVYPALCWLYPAKEARQAAVLRHLSPFNTHPYVAAAIVGGVLFHEERIARGEEGPERVEAWPDDDWVVRPVPGAAATKSCAGSTTCAGIARDRRPKGVARASCFAAAITAGPTIWTVR